jgi:cobalt-zinc-cadmium efflux system membrane fusion protein
MNLRFRVAVAAACVLAAGVMEFTGCSRGDSGSRGQSVPVRPPVVGERGRTIVFPADHPGLREIHTRDVKIGSALMSVVAPARVVASFSCEPGVADTIVMFESTDATSLYSQYRQSELTAARTARNLERIKDMYAHQSATARDLSDAESEASLARTTLAENGSKLRALGFSPQDFRHAQPGGVWIMCDVPESQLREVQKGEDVRIVYASMADRILHGRAVAVGEVIDPQTHSVKVRVTASNIGGKIMPGMFARVDFGDTVNNVVKLPSSAVVSVEGKDYAFVQTTPGTFERRPVSLLTSGSSDVIVSTGLAEGEEVVTDGVMLLKGLSFGY